MIVWKDTIEIIKRTFSVNQQQIADCLNVRPYTLSKIKSGSVSPPFSSEDVYQKIFNPENSRSPANEHGVATEVPLYVRLAVHTSTASIISDASYDFFSGSPIPPLNAPGFCCVQVINDRRTFAVLVQSVLNESRRGIKPGNRPNPICPVVEMDQVRNIMGLQHTGFSNDNQYRARGKASFLESRSYNSRDHMSHKNWANLRTKANKSHHAINSFTAGDVFINIKMEWELLQFKV